MTVLYVIWQDSKSRAWYPVGRLSVYDGLFTFVYTQGALASENFIPFGRLRNLESEYVSDELFPFFENRLLQKSRPEYVNYLRWMSLGENEANPIEELARTGGLRQTDDIALYPCPQRKKGGRYESYFFCHGVRYVSEVYKSEIDSVKSGTRLYPLFDIQNPKDPNAIGLRTSDPYLFLGYVPRYLVSDFKMLLEYKEAARATIRLKRNNIDAPSQMRLFCTLEALWPDEFRPCSGREYEPLAKTKDTAAAE